MSVTRQRPAEPQASTAPPAGWWLLGRLLRGTFGAVTLVGGLTWLLLYLHGPQPWLDLTVGLLMVAGGLVLLMPHRIPLPRRWTGLATALTALAGTAAGLTATAEHTCCTYAYVAGRGFPFPWLQQGAVAATPETARNLALTAPSQVDLLALAANLLCWGYAALLVVAAVGLVRRARSAD